MDIVVLFLLKYSLVVITGALQTVRLEKKS
jgi:hypothetical protein